MSSDFKSRFMNRMEHITRSGQTSSQNKSTTAVPNMNIGNVTNINNYQQSYTPSPVYEDNNDNIHTHNKPTAQQFQNYLNDFSPTYQTNDHEYNYPDNDYGYNNYNNHYNNNQLQYQETQSEQFNSIKYTKTINKIKRTKTNSARPHRKNNRLQIEKINRPVSLAFSKKPRKIQYKPYTLNDYHLLAPVSSGNMSLGADLEDMELKQKTKQLRKVREYAEIVNSKNKQHKPKPIIKNVRQKSKYQIAKEYAHRANQINKEKLSKSAYRSSPRFQRTGNAALSYSNVPSYSRKNQFKTKEMEQKITELQELHMRNRAMAQQILNEF
eukprot:387849_1